MTPDEYCQQKASQSGSSFYYSFLFLPPEHRQAITALYAFCREVDDVVDECPDQQQARAMLADWRNEVEALYAGKPGHPVTQALAVARGRFKLPRARLLEIIDGMEMDLEQNRYANFEALYLYCYRVASVVGLLAAEIFGYKNNDTQKYAHDLGLAFQLTNIIRDVGEDAQRGRIYLPLDELQRFNVPLDDLLNAKYSDNFRKLMEFQIVRADSYYDKALAQLPPGDRKAQRAGLIMARIYRTLLGEIKRGGCHVLDQRASLSTARKLWLAGCTWATT